ncbi:MAG: phage integrase N-terminal domain-containing protein [Gammaproteobacteria bacterium]
MRDLNYQLKQLCQQCREGAYNTQANREHILTLVANELHALGYRSMTARSLKPKHIEALVKEWFARELAIGTIKNRMAAIRWWARKVNKQNVVARSNEHYGIPDRRFVTNESKSKTVTQSQLDKVRDGHVRVSLELQQVFGLRREEAMKFQPNFADRGDHLVLKASWTKGGRERTIPVRTEEQRDVLNRARRLAGLGSLIPSNRNYRQQMRVYEGNTLRAGLSQMHGLRHAYAQNRYEELTGWKAPAAGGLETKVLTNEQRELDREARLIISRELGHEREQVTAAYLGK